LSSALCALFFDDVIAQVDALIADVNPGPGDHLLDLLLGFAAERAFGLVTPVCEPCHPRINLSFSDPDGSLL
jgi:hypothetical protein